MVLAQMAESKAQNNIAQKADSLFNTKKYEEAAKLYELIYNDNGVNKKNISLKLAYIYENFANYPKVLFYLGNYYNMNPNDEVFDKMNKIALENKYTGFDRSDLNFVIMIYQQYFIYILYIFIAIGVIIVFILLRKRKNGERIFIKHLILMALYSVFLGLIINAPNAYKSGIVKQQAQLREFPTSAAPIIGNISEGNKINIFGENDVWKKVFWNRKVVYINQKDVWVLENN